MRGAWIEIRYAHYYVKDYRSLPVRGAWIEIASPLSAMRFKLVAPRAGSVD